ncbi:uncharacterized protein [Choristoneura fumiferana]|uniref:uncharacterized protein n=1 Tax=Choristoneura fumiferana TaxID=7141 RepID=UPI003D15D30E
MTKICAACCKTMTTSQSIQCTKCESGYHHVCVNIRDPRKLSENTIKEWVCPVCQSNMPKKGNSNTPVRASTQSDNNTTSSNSANTNVTLRPQNRKGTSPLVSHEIGSDSDAITSLSTEVKLMRQEMRKMSEHMENLTKSFSQCNARLDNYESRFIALAKRIQVLEDREIGNEVLRQKVSELEEQLNTQIQTRLSNEIEIAGVNECPNESKMHIVLTAAQKIGLPLSEDDIDHVTRAGPKGSSSGDSRPRPLVVKFVRRAKRNDFLKAAKSRHNVTSASINVDGPSRKLYFNERLTKANRLLFREAREWSKNAGFKYCWTRNGIILIRKKPGCPEYVIRSAADLDRFHNTISPDEPENAEQPAVPSTPQGQE